MKLKYLYSMITLLLGITLIAGCGTSKPRTTVITNNTGANAITNAEEITWFGLDFTQAKFIGNFAEPEKIVSYYLTEWNTLTISEPRLYNIERVFKKKTAYRDIKSVVDRNKSVVASELFIQYTGTEIPDHFDEAQIPEVVRGLSSEQPAELGVAFIIDRFDQPKKEVSLYITFFNTQSKEVLFVAKSVTKAAGFGFRNFWAGGIKRALDDARRDYNKWFAPQ